MNRAFLFGTCLVLIIHVLCSLWKMQNCSCYWVDWTEKTRMQKNGVGSPGQCLSKLPGVHKVWMTLSDIAFELWVRPGVKLDDPHGSPPAGDTMILWWPPSHFRKKIKLGWDLRLFSYHHPCFHHVWTTVNVMGGRWTSLSNALGDVFNTSSQMF